MFGDNPIRSAEDLPHSLRVQSIFYTLQGEGPFSGMPAVFVRLAGCNLACHFCDTEFESGFHNVMSLAHIIKAVDSALLNSASQEHLDDGRSGASPLVVLTGGEPMLQQITPLVGDIIRCGYRVQIETAGTVWPDGFESLYLPSYPPLAPRLVCSPKTPKVHPMIEKHCRDWKYVVAAGEVSDSDGLPNHGTQKGTKDKHQILYRAKQGTIWCSPRDDRENTSISMFAAERHAKTEANVKEAVSVCLAHGYRLSLQVHKLVGLE